MIGCLPVHHSTSGMISDRLESCTWAWRASTIMTRCIMQVLKFYNLEGQSKWLNLLYETCFLFLFLVLAWWATHSPLRSTVAHSLRAHHLPHAWLKSAHAASPQTWRLLQVIVVVSQPPIFLLVQGWASIQAPHQPLMTAAPCQQRTY